jgi:hypothetical protein
VIAFLKRIGEYSDMVTKDMLYILKSEISRTSKLFDLLKDRQITGRGTSATAENIDRVSKKLETLIMTEHELIKKFRIDLKEGLGYTKGDVVASVTDCTLC